MNVKRWTAPLLACSILSLPLASLSLPASTASAASAVSASLIAAPSAASLTLNGSAITMDTYAIAGNTYVKLRDLAASLAGTDKEFKVSWDSASRQIQLTTGTAYAANGSEFKASNSSASKKASVTSTTIMIDGQSTQWTGYTIDGETYYKLRDAAETIDLGLAYSSASRTVQIDTAATETATSIPDASGTPPKMDGTPPSGAPTGGMTGGAGAVDKSGDTELQAMVAEVEGDFQQLEYTDAETGKTLTYNLYTPENYDPSKSYPLVMFIADSSLAGRDAAASLSQGYGGIIWATEEEQAKHESFVLVPTYPEVIIDDHGSFTTTDYVDMTARLLESVTSTYSVDTERIYGTGQSMGCMTIMYLSAKYPDLFAAELYVSGQWDVSELAPLADQTFFYIAAEGDAKASAGQVDLLPVLEENGASVSSAAWDATWSAEEFDAAVASLLAEGNAINFATFELGTVLPEGVKIGTSEHMYSFDYAYKIEAVRDWLFAQSK